MSDVYDRISEIRVVPVIAIESVDAAVPLADALLAGGLPIAEITFRTSAAADVIALLKKERPQLLIGAGTVLTEENARRAKDCGAQFAVSPGLNPAVVKASLDAGLPIAPGVMTPSDIEAGLSFGLKVLKFFPAGAAGGPGMLKSVAAPYMHLGVKFIPTGGVTLENMGEYLQHGFVLGVGGTWLAKKDLIAAADWDTITENCRAAVVAAAL